MVASEFHQGDISEVPLKISAWQGDGPHIYIIANQLQEKKAKPRNTWECLSYK